MSTELAEFNKYPVRRIWHNGEWYYSVVDVIAVLTDSPRPKLYWSNIKNRATSEGFEETVKEVVSLKLVSADKKLRETDAANEQTLFRLIQSIPSPKAEPFRLWLAQVGVEHVRQLGNAQHLLDKKKGEYRKKGYSEDWIDQRINNDITRNALTDEWEERGAEKTEYGILTNQIHEGTFDLTVAEHKDYKLLSKRANLRDHSSYLELALISLGEATAITLHNKHNSQGFNTLSQDAVEAGTAAGKARKALEESLGEPVVSRENFLPKQRQMSMFDLLSEPEEGDSEDNGV